MDTADPRTRQHRSPRRSDTAIGPPGLHFQFTLHAVVPAPHTLLRGTRKLEPAHSLAIEANGRRHRRRYRDLDATRLPEPRTGRDWVDATHAALLAAVRKGNDIADVPVGVLLSGGLDSGPLDSQACRARGLIAGQGVGLMRAGGW